MQKFMDEKSADVQNFTPTKRKVVVWTLKFCGANVCAFGVLFLICCFYSNLPLSRPQPNGATASTAVPRRYGCGAVEGHTFLKMDENGYNNPFPRKKPNPDILILGSSQMEGYCVPARQNACYLLNKRFQENGIDKESYNIGVSGHLFLECSARVPAAIKNFKPSEYVVIQFSDYNFSQNQLDQALNETPKAWAEGKPPWHIFAVHCISIPGVTLLAKQALNLRKKQTPAPNVSSASSVPPRTVQSINPQCAKALREVIFRVGDLARERRLKVIFAFTPKETLNKDGFSFEYETAPAVTQFMKSTCAEAGIVFVDMSDAFRNLYEKRNILPSGFWNTIPCDGHFNRYGHEVIAQELYKAIVKLEAEKELNESEGAAR